MIKSRIKLELQSDPINTNGQSQNYSTFGLGNIAELEEPEDYCDEIELEADYSVPVLSIEHALFSWTTQEGPVLSIPALQIPRGKLTIIVGRNGSGKSSLLCAMLGEVNCIKGAVRWTKKCSVAYVSQKPWLLNCSLRDNILFGQPYCCHRYIHVISATALQPDINILPGKDLTDIGERGINLSGGQRQRVAIARALYSKASVVIMDDPLSALDHQVAQLVFDRGIKKLVVKQKRTVILVTHNTQLIPHAHQVIILEKGAIKTCGTPLELERSGVNVMGHTLDKTNNGRTARERWHLIKLVSRIGLQLKPKNLVDGNWRPDHITPSIFVPFRRRLSKFSGSRYFTHDLPLPTDECEAEEEVEQRRRAASTTSLPPLHHHIATRTTSLQSGNAQTLYPVKRQVSSPTINNGARTRMFTFDITSRWDSQERSSGVGSVSLLRQLFSMSTQRSTAVASNSDQPPVHRLLSITSDGSDEYLGDYIDDDANNVDWASSQTLQEVREYGGIERRIYMMYLRACGIVLGATFLLATISWQGLRVYTDYWLTEWTEGSNNQAFFYLIVYGVLSMASILLSLVTNSIGQYCGARARQILHDDMLINLLNSPIKFFEITPLGRIMNRFSTDLSIIDKKIATSLQRLLQFLLLCFSAILVNCIVSPWFIAIAVPICLVYFMVQKFYRCSTRELQRIDSMTRTPILSHFAETLSGLEIIRAFGKQQCFAKKFFQKLDAHTNAFLIMNSCNRWLGIALDYLGGFIVFTAMVVSLVSAQLMPHLVSPALVGLAINYTLLVPIYLNWVVKFLADMEMYMGAVERVVHYANVPSEDYRLRCMVPSLWPKNGNIKFQGVSLQYDPFREFIISNLNLHIPAGQKIGICGRTGSGKSSLVMSLFHMVPVCEGSIFIDDTDISTIPLKELRSRLSVIPQDVIMFSGTIRENLDIQGEFSDTSIWESLEMAQMKDTVSTCLGGLYGQVKEGGENLSCGQRQLLCLARAILHRALLLVMDEATSSLDPVTERKFLQVAAQAFANRTVITIAHRLTGLLNCDRIIVLHDGHIVEDGSPSQLLGQKMGIFSSMLRLCEEPT